jgi:hypothetical protein
VVLSGNDAAGQRLEGHRILEVGGGAAADEGVADEAALEVVPRFEGDGPQLPGEDAELAGVLRAVPAQQRESPPSWRCELLQHLLKRRPGG